MVNSIVLGGLNVILRILLVRLFRVFRVRWGKKEVLLSGVERKSFLILFCLIVYRILV